MSHDTCICIVREINNVQPHANEMEFKRKVFKISSFCFSYYTV